MTRGDRAALRSAGLSAGGARWALPAVIAVLALPLLVAATRAIVDGVPNPGGDQAILELRVSDVGSHTPVLGSYNRFGANHPGPLWMYALAVPYRILGSEYGGLQVGALFAGGLSIAVVAWVAWRRGGRTLLLWTAAVLAVLVHALGPSWVADPWEPKGLTLVVAALLFATFDVAAGRAALLPVVGVLASLLAQAYAGMAFFAVAMGVIAVGATVARVLRRGVGRRTRRVRLLLVVGTMALVGLLWAPPLLQQLRNDPGNVTEFTRAMEASGEPELGLGDAWRAVSLELGHRATWLGNDPPLVGFSGVIDAGDAPLLPIGLVALAAVVVVMVQRRRRRATGLWLAGLVGVAIIVGVASLARLVGPLFVWIPAWTKVLGAGTAVAIGWCAHDLLDKPTRQQVRRFASPVLGLLIVALSVASALDALDDRTPDAISPSVQALVDDVALELDGPVLARSELTGTNVFSGAGAGLPTLVLALDRAGVDVVVAPDLANRYGDHRAHPERAVTEVVLLGGGQAPPGGFTVRSTVDPLTVEERAEVNDILRRIPVLAEDGPEALEALAELDDDPELGPLVRRYGELAPFRVLRLAIGPQPTG